MSHPTQLTKTYHSNVSLNGLGDTDADTANTQRFKFHTVEIDYDSVAYGGAADAKVEVWTSENGTNFNLADTVIIPAGTDVSTLNITEMVSKYFRIRLNGGTATGGTATVVVTHSE